MDIAQTYRLKLSNFLHEEFSAQELDQFDLYLMGSIANGTARDSFDDDSFIIFQESISSSKRAGFIQRIFPIFRNMGFRTCTNKMNISNPLWSGSWSQWDKRIAEWRSSKKINHLINLRALLDCHPVLPKSTPNPFAKLINPQEDFIHLYIYDLLYFLNPLNPMPRRKRLLRFCFLTFATETTQPDYPLTPLQKHNSLLNYGVVSQDEKDDLYQSFMNDKYTLRTMLIIFRGYLRFFKIHIRGDS